MPDETYVVELVAEPEKFAAGVRKAVNDLNKIEQTGRKIAAGEKASADASVRGYNAARARRDAAFSELTIVQKLVALEQRRAQLIGFMASAIHSGNTRRQALLGQGLSSVAAGSYLISASNPSAAREATTIIDTGTPNRGGGGRRAAGRRAPIALIGPPGDAAGRSLGQATPPALGRKGPSALDEWVSGLGLKGLAKLTGAGFAIGAITGMLREIASWPGLARESSYEARRVEAALKAQFEWSSKTRDNLAGLANVFTGVGEVLKNIIGSNLASYVELTKLLLRRIGFRGVIDKLFPGTGTNDNPVAREMELRRNAELAEIDCERLLQETGEATGDPIRDGFGFADHYSGNVLPRLPGAGRNLFNLGR
jgi:hypothetical protein